VFVIAPAYYEGTDGRAVSEALARVVEADLKKHHEVVGSVEAAKLVPREFRRPCPDGECAERLREASGAVAAIVIRVGRGAAGEGPATSFQLGIQPSPGVQYTRGALLADGRLEEIALRALREAFRDYRQGPGPWLEVVGAPARASVFVDEREAGTLPWTDTLPLGTHRIRVEARGFEPMTKIVTLSSPTERKKLEFRLEAAGLSSADIIEQKGSQVVSSPPVPSNTTAPESSRRRPILLGGGAGAVAVGGVLVGLGVGMKVRDGSCSLDSAGGCAERYRFGARGKVLLGIGVPLFLAGSALVAAGALTDATDTKTRVGLEVGRGTFGLVVGGAL
jgi:hypothetical protein